MSQIYIYFAGLVLFGSYLIIHLTRESSPPRIKKHLAFIHIPKNAGTTIEKLALSHHIRWGRHLTEEDHLIKQLNADTVPHIQYNWHIPPRFLKRYNPYEAFDTFCVVRNPLSRILSEYKWAHRNNVEVKDNPIELNKWIDFVLTIENVLEGEYVDDIGMKDGHLFPQHYFIFDENGRSTCDYILNMDHLEIEFNALMNMYGYDIKITKTDMLNKSNFKNITENDISTANLKKIRYFYNKDYLLYNNMS